MNSFMYRKSNERYMKKKIIYGNKKRKLRTNKIGNK